MQKQEKVFKLKIIHSTMLSVNFKLFSSLIRSTQIINVSPLFLYQLTHKFGYLQILNMTQHWLSFSSSSFGGACDYSHTFSITVITIDGKKHLHQYYLWAILTFAVIAIQRAKLNNSWMHFYKVFVSHFRVFFSERKRLLFPSKSTEAEANWISGEWSQILPSFLNASVSWEETYYFANDIYIRRLCAKVYVTFWALLKKLVPSKRC